MQRLGPHDLPAEPGGLDVEDEGGGRGDVILQRAASLEFDGGAPQSSSSRVERVSTSRVPTWLAGVTTPSFSICSISFAARL